MTPPAEPAGPLLLTAKEAYQLLGVGKTYFYTLVSTGRIRGVSVNGRRMYRRADLRRFVAQLKPARA